ncbi:hypothetical protein GCK72_007563 [Caenorhabditis remanei]|uniref:BTB domain-containing protein n=1 Tax=Caenorhabditis remanei TaxID=31234 RepID=A0A6A5HLW5_CAERE|nr:hypothetical protein GCK72_007563 [Caenorhabditis remanei]KAF1767604.1 hypothetical protein GCK72_007563 [Caenorhabditis remanei]
MSPLEKKFTISCLVPNVSEFYGDPHIVETHFNVDWKLKYSRYQGFLLVFLECMEKRKDYSIDVELKFQIKAANGATLVATDTGTYNMKNREWGWHEFVSWKTLLNNYVFDDSFTLQVHVTMKKMRGFGKMNLRSFDESVRECSDVVLVVGGQKFYLCKMYLSLQSSYFKSLFLGNFDECRKNEIELKDIDPEDFQNFMELLHGENSIDDYTVDGIAYLADMYDSPTAIRCCQDFLMTSSEKTPQEKLEISMKCNMKDLKEKSLKNINDLRSVTASNLDSMDLDFAKELLEKFMDL